MERPKNYDDPAVDEQWCRTAREEVTAYLHAEGVTQCRVGECPAWHVAPVVSVWAIESLAQPGQVGWWVVFGDMPTDYVSGAGIDHPRAAMSAIARRWKMCVNDKKSGAVSDDLTFGGGPLSDELVPLLESRAKALCEWTEDDDLWDPN